MTKRRKQKNELVVVKSATNKTGNYTSPDLYEILGIDKTATNDQIKTAYLYNAKLTHPDGPNNNPEDFKRVRAAYDILSDPTRRSKYDSTGQIDDAELKIDQEARDFVINIMHQVISNAVQNRQDIECINIVRLMDEKIMNEKCNHKNNVQELKTAIDKLTKVAKRFKSKTTHNLLQSVINKQIADLKQKQETGLRIQKMHDKASLILSDFSYEVKTMCQSTTSFTFIVS